MQIIYTCIALKLASSIFDRVFCLIKPLLDTNVDRNKLFFSVDYSLPHHFMEKMHVYMIYISFI